MFVEVFMGSVKNELNSITNLEKMSEFLDELTPVSTKFGGRVYTKGNSEDTVTLEEIQNRIREINNPKETFAEINVIEAQNKVRMDVIVGKRLSEVDAHLMEIFRKLSDLRVKL